MGIQMNCENCGYSMTVSDDKAGKRGKCPQCKTEIRVPTGLDRIEVGGPTTVEVARMGGKCPRCSEVITFGHENCESCGYNFISGEIQPERATKKRERIRTQRTTQNRSGGCIRTAVFLFALVGLSCWFLLDRAEGGQESAATPHREIEATGPVRTFEPVGQPRTGRPR